jgi:hypothetical protein
MGRLIIVLLLLMAVSCSININLNFDPEKLERAMDSFLDDIGYGKKDKKLPTLKLYSLMDVILLSGFVYAEEENPLEKIKNEMKDNHKFLEKYYENQVIGEALDGSIKIIASNKIEKEEELKKLKEVVGKQNSLRKRFFKEYAKEKGKDTEKAVEQVKEAFIKKTIERAKENNWCVEEKDENDNIVWSCAKKENK